MLGRERISRGPVNGRLEGKIILITGVGSGQGRAAAALFAKAGAIVVGSDISADGLAGTQDATSLDLDLAVVDASNEDQVTRWVEGAAGRHGGIDVVYNNGAGTHFAPFADMTMHQWRETLRLELDTVFIPTQAAWPFLIARGGGSVINIASISGMMGSHVIGGAGQAAHTAGKSGVIGFTRQLAVEGAEHWIRANAISPGPILTPATEAVFDASPDFKRFFEGIPLLRRAGRPLDVAYLGLFLASDESDYVTGANFVIDGGATAKVGISPLD